MQPQEIEQRTGSAGDGLVKRQSPAVRDAAVSVRNVTVSYEGKPVLRSVSMEVLPGQLVGVVGPNGAGKSTLLKTMLGLIEPDLGEVRIFGQPIDRARRRVAYVPQTEAVDWDFPVTVLDVVLMGRCVHWGWSPSRADRQTARDALEMVGMSDYADRHIRRLSGGQQKRVFLARGLCQGADVLLLDEPFAGVDAATERAIFSLIDTLTEQGKALLVVNHDLSVLGQFDALLLLNHRVIAFGRTAEVNTPENLQLTYGGRLSMLDRAEASLANPALNDHESPNIPGQERTR